MRGRVQKVGYRDTVAEIANGLDIGGIAKNLSDGTVRIIAEAEKETLENFIALIRPKDDPLIKVTGIDVKFEPATNEFEYFDIEYEDFNIEAFERIGTAATYLKRIDKKQDQMLETQEETIEVLGAKIDNHAKKTEDGFSKTDQNFIVLTKETKNGFERTDQNFTILRDDYGGISKDLTKAIQGIEQVAKNTGKLLEKSEEDRGESRNSINKLANAILKLAEKTG